MSESGHSLRFGGLCRTSALPPLATEERKSVYVGEGPVAEVRLQPLLTYFLFARDVATSRAQSMKSCVTGLSARVFSVTTPWGTLAFGR